MKLTTPVALSPSPMKVGLRDQVITVGSCFSKVVGDYLTDCQLKVLNNPFGTVYNPISISKLVAYAVGEETFDEEGFVQNGEVYHHLDFHSELSALSKDQLKQQINEAISQTGEWLRQANWLIITYGTSIVYRYQKSGHVVANCHRVPGSEFDRQFLTMEELNESLDTLCNQLSQINPKIQVVLTVSPVRHVRDGLEENAVSKALLRVLCQQAVQKHDRVNYFPSYEIMMDELRDYRFYENDLIHPNSTATEYIWECFKETYFSSNDAEIIARWEKLRRALAHRPRHPETKAHQAFLEKTKKELEELNQHLDLSVEIDQVSHQLTQR